MIKKKSKGVFYVSIFLSHIIEHTRLKTIRESPGVVTIWNSFLRASFRPRINARYLTTLPVALPRSKQTESCWAHDQQEAWTYKITLWRTAEQVEVFKIIVFLFDALKLFKQRQSQRFWTVGAVY